MENKKELMDLLYEFTEKNWMAVNNGTEEALNNFLNGFASEKLDIPKYLRDEATRRYMEIGEWLQAGTTFKEYDPDVYPHGSFAYGTIVKPLNREEFDLDIICQMMKDYTGGTSSHIKQSVGDRLYEDVKYNPCQSIDIDNHDRGYTLNFNAKFKMDVIPAIPNKYDRQNKSILVVDKKNGWCPSNPKGFAEWFLSIAKKSKVLAFNQGRQTVLADAVSPTDMQVLEGTPLQRAVQILKYHAMWMFRDDAIAKYKPASIIITTLMALSYTEEMNTVVALSKFKENSLRILIDNKYKLENPVNSNEFFTETWENDPNLKIYFLIWLDKIENFVHDILLGLVKGSHLGEIKQKWGILSSLSNDERITSLENNVVLAHPNNALAIRYQHEEIPKYKIKNQYNCGIESLIKNFTNVGYGRYTKKEERWENFTANDELAKQKKLKFIAKTSCPQPYKVLWQVVNAPYSEQERGQIMYEDEHDEREESTQYAGTHYVKCYILKGDIIVSESSRAYVHIK